MFGGALLHGYTWLTVYYAGPSLILLRQWPSFNRDDNEPEGFNFRTSWPTLKHDNFDQCKHFVQEYKKSDTTEPRKYAIYFSEFSP